MADGLEISDSAVVDAATCMIRFGAGALVQTVLEESAFWLYGPGFSVLIERTDPAAPYPGMPESD